MNYKFYTFVAILASTLTGILPAMGQKSGPVNDTIYMGASYINEVYYNMAAGNKGAVNRKQWDIAFRANRMSASILTNDAATNDPNSLGVELYTYPKSDTSGWATMDTVGYFKWKKMVNSKSDWEEGAFCRNQKGHPDYGWGKYNASTHNVMGDSLFIIKLRDGSLRKLWIKEKFSSDNVFNFRYAKIDGSGDTTIMLDCNPYSTKNFVGYSISTKQIVDFEPAASSQWDIMFTKYMYTYPDGTLYPVTGMLSNYGVKVNTFHPVPLTYKIWDKATMDSTRSAIGWEWKKYNSGTNKYEIIDSTVYFVQDKGGNIHKLVFKEFVGGTSSRVVFQKEMISALGIDEMAKSDFNVAVYPNPVKDLMNLVINPGNSASTTISLMDISGRKVFSNKYELPKETLSTLQVPVSGIPAGMYIVVIQNGTNTVSRKVLVNN
ncbi:MAG: T9SS type A sorting domain-containing protein [Bacteroidota bacterium]